MEFVADTASPGISSRGYQGAAPNVTASLHISETYQATFNSVPLPSADAMERLARLYPDAPRIIFEEMRSQAEHRRDLERRVIATKNSLAVRGQIIGGLLGGVGLVGSLIVAALGHGLAGFGIAMGSLGSLVSLFVLGRSVQQKNLEAKTKIREKMSQSDPVETISLPENEGGKPQVSSQPDRRKKPTKASKKPGQG